uniref:Uncharacterized protein n=2 Tax=Clytia hemisphaerica TaxID=252671 RepID=A0A7M5WVE2_9CNID
DYGNGRYIAYFRPHLAGSYTLHLTLEHSLCDGLLDPPSNWFQLGDSHGRYQNEDGFKISDTLLTEAIQPINFEVPSSEIKNRKANLKCQRENCILNTNHGYWSGKNFIDLATGRPVTEFVSRKLKRKLKSFAAFGDSLTYRFYGLIKEKCLKLFYFCNPVYTWSYKVKKKELKNKIIYDGLDFDESRFLGEIHAAMKGKTVFLINFGLHHVSTLPMERCFKLFQQFIKLVKIKRKKGIGPLVIWKTTTPPFLENRQDKTKNADWHHYRTKQRIEVWNSYTIEECCKAGIDVLDVYEMALSSPKKTLDGVHYPNTVFESAE